MTQSDTLDKLATALHAAVASIRMPKPNQTDEKGERYADFAAIMRAVKKPLHDNGLTLVMFGGFSSLTVALFHASGQFISETAPVAGDGAYGPRNAVMRLLGMVERAATPRKATPSLMEIRTLYNKLLDLGLSEAQIIVLVNKHGQSHDDILEAGKVLARG